MTSSAMNSVAEDEGFIVAYPNAIDDNWSYNEDHDVGFIDTLLASVGSEYSIDPRGFTRQVYRKEES